MSYTIKVIREYEVEVEADSEDSALNQAEEAVGMTEDGAFTTVTSDEITESYPIN